MTLRELLEVAIDTTLNLDEEVRISALNPDEFEYDPDNTEGYEITGISCDEDDDVTRIFMK